MARNQLFDVSIPCFLAYSTVAEVLWSPRGRFLFPHWCVDAVKAWHHRPRQGAHRAMNKNRAVSMGHVPCIIYIYIYHIHHIYIICLNICIYIYIISIYVYIHILSYIVIWWIIAAYMFYIKIDHRVTEVVCDLVLCRKMMIPIDAQFFFSSTTGPVVGCTLWLFDIAMENGPFLVDLWLFTF